MSVQDASTENVTTRTILFPQFPVRTTFDLQQGWSARGDAEATNYEAILSKKSTLTKLTISPNFYAFILLFIHVHWHGFREFLVFLQKIFSHNQHRVHVKCLNIQPI